MGLLGSGSSLLSPKKFGDISGGNYTEYEADGTPVSKGDATTWEDVQFQISAGRVPAANFPSYETFTTNTREYAFDVNEFIDLAANEPLHSMRPGSTASFHAHITNKAANSSGASQYVKTQIIVAYAAVNGVWTEVTYTGECEIPDGTSALTHKLCVIDSVDMTDIPFGSQIKIQLKRIAATGGTEYASQAFYTQVGLHIEQDMNGSRTASSK